MHSDPLRDAKSKIKWAKGQIAQLQPLFQSFIDSQPYTTIEKVDNEKLTRSFVLIATDSIPDEFDASVTQCVNAIRSSLDLLIAGLIRLTEPSVDKTAKFPFGRTKEIFETEFRKGAEKKLPAGAADIIRALQPYKGGNDVFFALHNLDIIGKHRQLLAMRVYTNSSSIGGGPSGLMIDATGIDREYFVDIFPQKLGGYLEEGVTVLVVPIEARTDIIVETDIHIVFGNFDVVEGQSALPLLQQYADFVERIILTFERRFFPPRQRW